MCFAILDISLAQFEVSEQVHFISAHHMVAMKESNMILANVTLACSNNKVTFPFDIHPAVAEYQAIEIVDFESLKIVTYKAACSHKLPLILCAQTLQNLILKKTIVCLIYHVFFCSIL